MRILLIVALLLHVAVYANYTFKIPNHRMMCRKADGTDIPLSKSYIGLWVNAAQGKTWDADKNGFIRNSLEYHNVDGPNNRIDYYVDCAKFASICPGVERGCRNGTGSVMRGAWIAYLPLARSIPDVNEKFLNGGWCSITTDPDSDHLVGFACDWLPVIPVNEFTLATNTFNGFPISPKSVRLSNHRMMCRNNEGIDVPMGGQGAYLHQDWHKKKIWFADKDGYIRDNKNYADLVKLDGKTSLFYYVECDKFGPICPGVKNACAGTKSQITTDKNIFVFAVFYSLPDPGQKWLKVGACTIINPRPIPDNIDYKVVCGPLPTDSGNVVGK